METTGTGRAIACGESIGLSRAVGILAAAPDGLTRNEYFTLVFREYEVANAEYGRMADEAIRRLCGTEKEDQVCTR